MPSTNIVTKSPAVHHDAIVIGAGISGLAAGKVLKDANFDFLILEGADCVGGRISTVEMKVNESVEKLLVDTGAQWIHGRNNELFKYADAFKLIRNELSEEAEGNYVKENGVIIDDFFVKKVDFAFGQILEECEGFVKFKHEKDYTFPPSLEDYVDKKFKYFVDALESDDEKKTALQLLDWHRRFVSLT